ncbi:hypothetical protein M758_7G016300 [Ceratodon purpureus]|nr:hypothetical protein M758_7G016300 [Ceratodon purpureus]
MSQSPSVVDKIIDDMNEQKDFQINKNKTDVENLEFALVDATVDSIVADVLVEEHNKDKVNEMKNDVSSFKNNNLLVEEILDKDIIEFDNDDQPQVNEIAEKMNENDVDMLDVNESIVKTDNEKQDLTDTKGTELPRDQGIHALVDNVITYTTKT